MTRVRPWRDPIPSPGGTTPWSDASTLTATWGVGEGTRYQERGSLTTGQTKLLTTPMSVAAPAFNAERRDYHVTPGLPITPMSSSVGPGPTADIVCAIPPTR
jgi:hypothetical protein